MNEDLSTEELAVLQRFAEAYGRQWKAGLRESWNTGHYRWHVSAADAATLQQIRNTKGPAWLTKFRFPKGEAA
jgi:hypothetical protein